LYSDDGGATWEIQTSGTSQTLYDIDIEGVNDGHVVGSKGTILHTEDGLTWEKQISGENEQLFSVWIYSYDVIWAVGRDGIILKADNGGHPHD
jgi:photosystem II stability/assembly factor-like uncharacterized protein